MTGPEGAPALATGGVDRGMFFYLAKVLWYILQPSCFIAFLLLIGTVMVWTYWARWGRRLVALAALLLITAGLSPLGNWLVLPLEDRFPRTDLDATPAPTGFIVLGGSEDRLVADARQALALNEAGDRLVAAAILARQFPQAKIVFTGGDAGIFYSSSSEAAGAESLLGALGVPERQLVLEPRARDTFENAAYTKQLLQEQGLLSQDSRWILVTSAYHMPRAMGCFRAVGLEVEPWPVDYRTRGKADLMRFFDKVSEGLRRVDMASREWVGMAAYWMTGRIPSLFPAPEPGGEVKQDA